MSRRTSFPLIPVIGISWILLCTGFVIGIAVYSSETWPYDIIVEVEEYISGGARDISVMEKIRNDLNFKPSRHISEAQEMDFEDYRKNADYSYRSVPSLPLNPRRENPRIFIAENAPEGYRLIYGSFDFDDTLHGAVLLAPDGSVENYWKITQEDVSWQHRKDETVFPHGMEITRDGSLITAYDGGTSLTKYDYCGNVVWQLKGGYHHSVTLDGRGALWTWGVPGKPDDFGNMMVKIDVQTGKVLKAIDHEKVYEANPNIDIIGVFQKDYSHQSKWLRKGGERWHPNDVDPLRPSINVSFPGFNTGDLLVSLRTGNLIYILDPESLLVKWWRMGFVRRQHDPDWTRNGTITVFNNNMHRDFSTIVEIDPRTYEFHTILDGRQYGFYTWMRGKHQRLPDGGLLITSAQQGRAFEVNADGQITFDFLNVYGGEKEYLFISEARFLPPDFFSEGVPACE